MSSNNSDNVETNVERIIELIMEKKGEDIVVIDVRSVTSVTDFLIIATGNSNVHVKAIANEVREMMKKKHQINPWHVEGLQAQKWILLDYIDIIVHIFDSHARSYYNIEKLWEDVQSRHIKTNY